MVLDDMPGRHLFIQGCEIDDIYGTRCCVNDVDAVRGFAVEDKKLIALGENDAWRFLDISRTSGTEKGFKDIFADHSYWANNIAKKEDDDLFKRLYY